MIGSFSFGTRPNTSELEQTWMVGAIVLARRIASSRLYVLQVVRVFEVGVGGVEWGAHRKGAAAKWKT